VSVLGRLTPVARLASSILAHRCQLEPRLSAALLPHAHGARGVCRNQQLLILICFRIDRCRLARFHAVAAHMCGANDAGFCAEHAPCSLSRSARTDVVGLVCSCLMRQHTSCVWLVNRIYSRCHLKPADFLMHAASKCLDCSQSVFSAVFGVNGCSVRA